MTVFRKVLNKDSSMSPSLPLCLFCLCALKFFLICELMWKMQFVTLQLTIESQPQVLPLYSLCVCKRSSGLAMHIGPALKWKSACAPLNPSPAAKHTESLELALCNSGLTHIGLEKPAIMGWSTWISWAEGKTSFSCSASVAPSFIHTQTEDDDVDCADGYLLCYGA